MINSAGCANKAIVVRGKRTDALNEATLRAGTTGNWTARWLRLAGRLVIPDESEPPDADRDG
jgi:hypothetical protein